MSVCVFVWYVCVCARATCLACDGIHTGDNQMSRSATRFVVGLLLAVEHGPREGGAAGSLVGLPGGWEVIRAVPLSPQAIRGNVLLHWHRARLFAQNLTVSNALHDASVCSYPTRYMTSVC